MNLNTVLNNTAGRFTTLVITRNNKSASYCAKINSATSSMVSFYDVNASVNRKVKPSDIAFARSGRNQYRKARR